MDDDGSAHARRWFAEDIRVSAPVLQNPDVIEAFARVQREHYLGPGPWRLHSRLDSDQDRKLVTTEVADLYHDVLVTINDESGINSGLPSLWALGFDHLDIKPGSTILQVGAGVGYFTAILAELVGEYGRVIAYEVDNDLFNRAQAALQDYKCVDVRLGDATQAKALPSIDIIVAFAGVTHIPNVFLHSLVDSGRIVCPLTGVDNSGIFALLVRRGDVLSLNPLAPCGFYPCAGARIDAEAETLSKAFSSKPLAPSETALYIPGIPPQGQKAAWVVGEDYWIKRSN